MNSFQSWQAIARAAKLAHKAASAIVLLDSFLGRGVEKEGIFMHIHIHKRAIFSSM